MREGYISFWTLVRFWISYLNPFLPSCPAIGREEEADSVLAQSLGRNTWTDEEMPKAIAEIREEAGFNDIETFRLMKERKVDAGQPNLDLAWWAMGIAINHNIPIYAQWEVAYAMWERFPAAYAALSPSVRIAWPSEGYFSTFHVFADLREKMRADKVSRPYLVAPSALAVRAVAILWRLGLFPITAAMSWRNRHGQDWWSWDKNSIQPWTRSFGIGWIIREAVARYIHHPFGVVKFGKHPYYGRWVQFIPEGRRKGMEADQERKRNPLLYVLGPVVAILLIGAVAFMLVKQVRQQPKTTADSAVVQYPGVKKTLKYEQIILAVEEDGQVGAYFINTPSPGVTVVVARIGATSSLPLAAKSTMSKGAAKGKKPAPLRLKLNEQIVGGGNIPEQTVGGSSGHIPEQVVGGR